MKLSVNILSWNCFDVLRQTIHNLANDLKDIEHEVIIVDNGSTDGSQELATIRNTKNVGISIAKNQGIDASRGEYILLIDSDVLYVRNSIRCFINWLEQNPNEYAIGFYRNKFSNQKNNGKQVFYEDFCYMLHSPVVYDSVCLYYGMFRKSMFDLGIKLITDSPFNKAGYGWEDTDLFLQMRDRRINQWVAGLNSPIGRYYHEINSSIRQMGHEEYINTSQERAKCFNEKWTS